MTAVTGSSASLTIRSAEPADTAVLERLIEGSARRLGRGFYTDAQIEAAIEHVFGVDSELIADGSYFVAERGRDVVGCGGWSRRATMFGGDRYEGRVAGLLDPASEAARIRAFFVAPEAARNGVGKALLAVCCEAASRAGFRRLSLMATLSGVPFYRRFGFVPDDPIRFNLGETTVPFVPMAKRM